MRPFDRAAQLPLTADPVKGFFGPGSQMWRINREVMLLGAGPAALLMQLAHPLVAEGVAAHSDFQDDPFARLDRTLGTTLGMVFGNGATAEACVRRLNGIHAGVVGIVTDPVAARATAATSYRAMDPELLLWVQSTLVINSVVGYRLWVGHVSEVEADELWRDARALGERLGIPPSHSPDSYAGLEAWSEHQLRPDGPITVTPTARRLATSIIRPPVPLLPGAALDVAASPGMALLPVRIRAEYGIPWSAGRAVVASALSLGIRSWTRLLPASLRSIPKARAADRRVRRSGNGLVQDGRARSNISSATIPAATQQESSIRA